MPCQLPAECLNEIFEYLEEDITLRSCLLVNRLWCQIAVRILWMNVWRTYYVPLAIFSTLIACLPNESKDLLNANGIFLSPPTSKPPLFNYASFCKVLPISKIDYMVERVLKKLKDQLLITSQSLHYKKYLVSQELLKMFMKQISSLKFLDYGIITSEFPKFTYFPGAKDCLTDLSVFSCNSEICPEIFYQLSQICYNIQTFTIIFESSTNSDGLANLISLQNNLKRLNLYAYEEGDWTNIISALTKNHGTLTKLHLYSDRVLPLSFVASFSNLQEIKFSFVDGSDSEDFKEIQNITFPRLEILEIPYQCPKAEYLVKFLGNNGKNLKELNIDSNSKSFKLSIAQFCPNLKNLFIILKNDELDVLKTIFNNCHYLESIEVYCDDNYLNGKEVLKIIAIHSQKNFYELKLFNENSELLSEDLESFFISWKSRTPKKALALIIMKHEYKDVGLDTNEGNMKVIEKYKELGIIKKFETKLFEEEDN